MRVKVKGEITPERLSEALLSAVSKYEAVRPGCKIYGANLYLTAFDVDGLPFDLTDHLGNSLSITIDAKSGELVRPALTADGELKRQEAKRKEAEAKAQQEATWAKEEAKWESARQRRREQEALAKKQFDAVNRTTASLLESMPERLVDALNETVRGVWNDLQPIETQGKKKGQPKALPIFSIGTDGLSLFVETWKHPKRVLNPVCTFSHGETHPFWMHDAWAEATRRLITQLETLSAIEKVE